MNRLARFVSVIAFIIGVGGVGAARADLYPPTRYLSFNDSPLAQVHFNDDAFFLEDFEDGELNVPNVHISAGAVKNPSDLTDSVDLDDGVLDGFGRKGHSWVSEGNQIIRITFDGGDIGLPTHVGIVWTDGGLDEVENGQEDVRFEYFDKYGRGKDALASLFGDGRQDGTTDDDRFTGSADIVGRISAIEIRALDGSNFNFEIDHLQFGVAPEPGAIAMVMVVVLALRRSLRCAPSDIK